MQQNEGKDETELTDVKGGCKEGEEERGGARVDSPNKATDTVSNGSVAETAAELGALSQSNQGLKIDEKAVMESREGGNGKVEELEDRLIDKDVSLEELKKELSKTKSSEVSALQLLSESKKRIEELEAELDKGKEMEKSMLDSFKTQTKQLEQTEILLEESKLTIQLLRETTAGMEASSGLQNKSESLMDRAPAGEKHSGLKGKSLPEEIELLRHELKLATKAEENSKKAMDDLALALMEVATEAQQAKEKLASTQEELEKLEKEANELNAKLKGTEERHRIELDEMRKECDRYRNTAERLTLEAEESVLAWNGKETGFVECIKRAEEEKHAATQENSRLHELLAAAENMSKTAKQENQQVRDILKQALNEANVAREAARIAQTENSQLKDILAEKDDALIFITRENENLRINEASAMENIKELKRLLVEATDKEGKAEDKDHHDKQRSHSSVEKEHHKDGSKRLHGSGFSFNLKDLITPHKHKDTEKDHKTSDSKANEEKNEEDTENSDPLKGSIFDPTAESSPVAAVVHQRKKSWSGLFTDSGEAVNLEDYEHPEGAHVDDSDSERNCRKKKALLRRFGDILVRRKSTHSGDQSLGCDQDHKKEPSKESSSSFGGSDQA